MAIIVMEVDKTERLYWFCLTLFVWLVLIIPNQEFQFRHIILSLFAMVFHKAPQQSWSGTLDNTSSEQVMTLCQKGDKPLPETKPQFTTVHAFPQ